jgi:ribosome-binding factor A
MEYPRSARVEEAIKEEISYIVQNQLKDPRIGFVTVTRVEVTPDLRNAVIYFSVLGTHEEQENALRGLESSKGLMRALLGKRLRLKFIPTLSLKLDRGAEESEKISRLLHKIHEEEEKDDKSSGS